MILWLEISAVAVCAITGALEAGRREMDLFGASVVAFVAAVGGGTLRDILLGRLPVFWIESPVNLYVALLAVIGTFFAARRVKVSPETFLVPDAMGLALFTMLGTQKALALHSGATIAIVMGVVTGVFGGILRDILCNEVPVVFRGELYATAALIGASLFTFLDSMGAPAALALTIAILATFVIRLIALHWKLKLPKLSSSR